MMKTLIIIGAGGHGKVVADAAEQMAHWNEIVFVDLLFPELKKCGSWDVVAKNFDALENQDSSLEFVVAIGDNATRLKVFLQCTSLGFHPVSIIHPSSYISPYVKIGAGSVVFANAVVNVSASLGRCCIVNTGATIDHDCTLGESVHISPGANIAGEVSIGDKSWVGIGACVKQQIEIGDNVIVGAGAAVVSNVSNDLVVTGTPARQLSLS